MAKDLIKLGDIVVDRRGKKALAVYTHNRKRDITLLSDVGFMPLRVFSHDLKTDPKGKDGDFDIMKVYRYHGGWGHGFQETLDMVAKEREEDEDEVEVIFDRLAEELVEVDGQKYSVRDLKQAIVVTGLKAVESDEEDFEDDMEEDDYE